MNFCKVTTYIDEYEMIIIVTLTMSKHEFTMILNVRRSIA